MWGLALTVIGGFIGGPIGLAIGVSGLGGAIGAATAQSRYKSPGLVPVLEGMVSSMDLEEVPGPFLFSQAQWAWLSQMSLAGREGNEPLMRGWVESLQTTAIKEEMAKAGWPEDADPTFYMLLLGKKQAEAVPAKRREALGLPPR
jgi:hypothetical protein